MRSASIGNRTVVVDTAPSLPVLGQVVGLSGSRSDPATCSEGTGERCISEAVAPFPPKRISRASLAAELGTASLMNWMAYSGGEQWTWCRSSLRFHLPACVGWGGATAMAQHDARIIAVVGATGLQGGAVTRRLLQDH